MKLLKIFLIIILAFSVSSCGSDDDICLSGEATPRVKIKFKTQSNGKLKILDSLFVKVDYGQGAIPVLATASADSVLIPLRVDDVPFTKIYVGLSKKEIPAEIQLNYQTASEYVSPACGIKKIYRNLQTELQVPAAVVGIEQIQTQIIDESKTHLFLLF